MRLLRLSLLVFTTMSTPVETEAQPLTILISIDGFRWDYQGMTETPVLDALAARGVSSRLIPTFPTMTFTSHHSIATGLHPAEHGVVGNTMYDPGIAGRFSMGKAEMVRDGRWWGGEPIWVTVEKAGRIAATYFWPGTEAVIGGVRPTHWVAYDDDTPNGARIDTMLAWLDSLPEERPAFGTLYFSHVDGAGHRHGPDSEEVRRAVAETDRLLGLLVSGLEDLGLMGETNLVIVADHGMAQLSPDSVIYIDDYVDTDQIGVLSLGQYVSLQPDSSHIDEVFSSLEAAHPALKVYRRGSIPERFHLDGHVRTPPIIGVVRSGWSVSTRSWVSRHENPFLGGGHGYDNEHPDMAGLFIAAGPAFKRGVTIPRVDAVDVYNMLASSLGLEPAQNSGDASTASKVLSLQHDGM